MQNKIKDKSASNVMDIAGYWREYPERDLEHVRRYPVTVERLAEKDVWRKQNIKIVCVLPESLNTGKDKDDYIIMIEKELLKQSGEDYIKGMNVEEIIIWDQGACFDEVQYKNMFKYVENLFGCIDDVCQTVYKEDFKDIEIWNYEEPILAAGAGAAGYIKGCDYFNTESIADYSKAIAEGNYPIEKAYPVSAQEILARTIRQAIYRGKLSLKEFHKHHGFHFEKAFEEELKELVEKGYLHIEEEVCVFLQKGKEKEILSRLVQY